jgi:hypothetical protein
MAGVRKHSVSAVIAAGLLSLSFSGCLLKHQPVAENDGQSFKTDDGICHFVNPGSLLHPVVFCETGDELRLEVLQKRYVYDKKFLEQKISAQLRGLTAATDVKADWLHPAAVEVWVSAPVLAPQEAHLVVVVRGRDLGFAVFLPPDPAYWDFTAAPVVQLGPSGYPAAQTWKSGEVVMVADRSIRQADWQRFSQDILPELGSNPAGMARVKSASFAGEGVKFATEVFSEAQVARQVQASRFGRKYRLKPVWIPAVEPDTYKARGYAFSLKK